MPTATLGHRLKRLRLQAGLSQAELARRADVHLMTVSRIERQARNGFHMTTMLRLAEVLHVSLEYLLTGREIYGRQQ